MKNIKNLLTNLYNLKTMFLNQATIIGNITRDPELKSLPNGNKVCTFSVATNKVFTDKNGTKQEKVEFHNIIVFGKTAENVAKYMKKGNQILVLGEIQTRSWDDKTTGEKKYRTEILANSVQFGHKPQGQSNNTQQEEKPQVEGKGADLETIDFGDVQDDNFDDIPF